jgi:Ca2+-binding EF-hand superfamily protein
MRQSMMAKSLIGDHYARGVYSGEIFEKLKNYLKAGKKALVDTFKQFDKHNTGKVSSVEFKSIIKQLNLGLSSIEINQLFDYVDISSDGYVDWMKFINKIVLR